jgi:hypothetical protein
MGVVGVHASLRIGLSEAKAAGVVIGRAEELSTISGLRTQHRPVLLVSVSVRDERVEDQISGEYVEGGELCWSVEAGRRADALERSPDVLGRVTWALHIRVFGIMSGAPSTPG